MNEQARRAYQLFAEFGEYTGKATSPDEHRRLWNEWSAGLDGTPAVTQTRDALGGVDVEWIMADGVADEAPVIMFLHGGGFSSGSTQSHLPMMAHISALVRCRVLGVNYRLNPEHRFPAQIEDATAVYRALIKDGRDPSRLAFAGDSAGGGLAFSTLLMARNTGLPMPAAAIGIGPWVDLAVTGASMVTNADRDPVVKGEGMRNSALLFLDGVSPYLPLASPIYADLSGLPPILVQVGSGEALLDDAQRLVGRADQCGIAATLTVYPDMVHGWHQFAAFLPEARDAIAEIRDFLNRLDGWNNV